ncbi:MULTISPECIES: N-carbamoylputrescine amidase [unclassified Paenibacillus]|uniref:N-carbamoylputrescine amidase n=1 Tax=unclassified Paenibacillus TaxID=185978 RepID=UPI002404B359|nr:MULTISPECIES: N-carbamoylputrescine amidase [unclassified Paenibacillus]MDF9840882.1 N-carbamoylputrescine amidase [Paenibacillus sp. PastF-2]MDF9847466.1 N-carbamoylputrescine amidase [Paenibacillus sp. PastM-2]MDF9853957.1 N-carbamoylputrescine amidase [Paenibacillus sp. PastF-1]MDH6479229.1 N-carbamoylputrescine amidase [Paenibacillus sp. PastH-2]MDH6507035.1 N-carbamoylputrescine amidase [Paenibacillus sp. PastM-3]
MRKVTVAATQMSCSGDIDENIRKAEVLVREAAAQGAQIILLQELFETPYFCQKEKSDYYAYATELENNKAVNHFKAIAKELQVVLPISFYEKKNYARYNSLAVIDADGTVLGKYRKSHIPDGPGYEEKFYFNPGDTGFKVWNTRYAKIGVGVCWDQWYPEAARVMSLMGAEILFYPTAIGSEPQDGSIDSKDHWQTCMLGHAAANLIPVVASNRIGEESDEESSINFYGSSFIAGPQGNKVVEAGRDEQAVLVSEFDLDALEVGRIEWGIFRDRRPELYRMIASYDGDLTF